MPSAGGAPRPMSPEGMPVERYAISPDGRSVAAVAADGAPTLFPTDGSASRPLAGLARGDLPLRFSSDGKQLYVVRGHSAPAHLFRLTLDGGALEPWREIMPADLAGVPDIAHILLTPDGAGYVYSIGRMLNDLFLVDGLR
jgi:hypothetical protein